MKVAITGGTGFVGARLARTHVTRGDEVRVLTRRASVIDGARLFRGDLASGDVPRAFVAGADVLYHCAGELRDERRMHAVHVEGTRALLACASGQVGRWVHLSSVGVYGRPRDGVITEDSPEAPVGTYEKTKADSDRLARAAGTRGELATVVLRPSTIFGPDMPNQSLFGLIGAIDRGFFFFVGGPHAAANYIPVENVVQALLLCGSSAAAAGGEFNLSDTISMEKFIGTIADALGRPAPRVRLARAPLRAAAAVLGAIPGWPLTASRVDALSCRATYSSARIESTLGYRHSIAVEEALRRTVARWTIIHRRAVPQPASSNR